MTTPDRCLQIIHDPSGGPPERLELGEAPMPVPGTGELLIAVEAAGVNRPDVMQRQGRYAPPPGASTVLGLEVAGRVVAVGNGDTGGFAIGDAVCALCNGGGYATYCAVPAGQCLPWPRGFDAVRSAALPENLFTVWSNLVRTGRLAAGERVLVHGGSSGIGLTAIQVARALGADVIATAGTAEKCAMCRKFGASEAIDYRKEDFAERVDEITGGRGVDVILDMVGASYLGRNLRSLAEDGRLVIIALQGGAQADGVELAPIMTRRLVVTGSTLRPRNAAYKAELAAALRERVWPLLEDGTIRPLIHAVLPLAEAGRAHALLESGTHSGKIVLQVDGGGSPNR